MALVDQDNLSHDSVFRQRIRMCLCLSAAAVQAEPAQTANHVNRSNFARSVLNSPDAYVGAMSAAVACDPNNAGISARSTDSDLEFTTNALFNALAGII